MSQVTERPKMRFHNMSERLNAPIPGYTSNEGPKPEGDDPESRAIRKVGADGLAMLRYRAANGNAGALDELKRHGVSEKGPGIAAKARHKAVMASNAVKGKEKQAAELLLASCKSGSKFASADVIIAELGKLPTDAQLSAVDAHKKSVAAQKVWDRAAAIVAAERGRPLPQSASEQSVTAKETVWDRAWAKIEGARS